MDLKTRTIINFLFGQFNQAMLGLADCAGDVAELRQQCADLTAKWDSLDAVRARETELAAKMADEAGADSHP